MAVAYNLGSKEADEYRKAIILTGNASGTTAGQLQTYAQQISAVVGTQGKVPKPWRRSRPAADGSENLKQFSQTAIEFERATGTAISETVKKFAELKNAPLQASLKLNETTNFLRGKPLPADQGAGKIRPTEAAALAQNAFDESSRRQAGEDNRWGSARLRPAGSQSRMRSGRPVMRC